MSPRLEEFLFQRLNAPPRVDSGHVTTIKRAEDTGREGEMKTDDDQTQIEEVDQEQRKAPERLGAGFKGPLSSLRSLRLKPHCFSSTRWYFLSL